MVNRYLLLKDIKNKLNFTALVSSGIVPINISNKLTIYEKYLNQLTENDKSTSIQYVADFYNISNRNVYRIIEFMEGKNK